MASALPKRDPQWLEVKLNAFYGEEQPAGMSVPEFALTLVQLLQVKSREFPHERKFVGTYIQG